MRYEKIAGHDVEMYDSIDQLPMERHHIFNKCAMLDSGIGSSLEDIDKRVINAIQMIQRGDQTDAIMELNNMRSAFINVTSEVTPRSKMFAVLVRSIDNQLCDDMSPDGLARITKKLSKATKGQIDEVLEDVKKKSMTSSPSISHNIAEAASTSTFASI